MTSPNLRVGQVLWITLCTVLVKNAECFGVAAGVMLTTMAYLITHCQRPWFVIHLQRVFMYVDLVEFPLLITSNVQINFAAEMNFVLRLGLTQRRFKSA